MANEPKKPEPEKKPEPKDASKPVDPMTTENSSPLVPGPKKD